MQRFRFLDVTLLVVFLALLVSLAKRAEATPPGLGAGSELRLTLRNSEEPVRVSFLEMGHDNGVGVLRVEANGDSLTIPTSRVKKMEIKTGEYSGQEVKDPVAFGILVVGTALGCAYWAASSTDGSTGLKILAGLGGAYGGLWFFGKIAHETWPVHNKGAPRWETVPLPVSTAKHLVPDPTLRVGLTLQY